MKRGLLTLSLLTTLLGVSPAFAEDKTGGLVLSGNTDVVVGFQFDDSKALGTTAGGQLGYFKGPTVPSSKTFRFFLDQFELDINKSFGENVRIRADLDFGRVQSGSGRNTDSAGTGSNFEIEQAYVTLNLKGVELLFGRFNAPIGYYVVDRADNPTLSFSPTFLLLPTNLTGAKAYYSFNSHVDLSAYVVNNLTDFITNDNPTPSFGGRLGFNWGGEDKKSTLGLAYAGGPEPIFNCTLAGGCKNSRFIHIAALDLSWKITPSLLLGADAVYRQDAPVQTGAVTDRAFGAFGLIDYQLNDLWAFYFRYGFVQDRTGFYLGSSQNEHDFAIGARYRIADGAKLKIEYNPTLFDPRGVGKSSLSHGFGMEFAYSF